MTGACHHLRPAAVFYDDRPEAQKAVLSIAGAKIQRFLVSDKFRHVIRSDFQQLTILKRIQYSVFSFFAIVTILCIDSILYIY